MQNYEQVKVLGQGGFGKAILGKRKTDGYMVCIKEVRLSNLNQKDREESMKEIKVLAALSHPYIVKYIESFQERGNLYIVMEYANGGDLSQKIEKQGRTPFSEEDVMKYFIQIALAIKYIHDRKILHRDLKGQNVFLMKDGTVKLGDFGIARVLEHTFQVCKTQIGTPFYLSPEICQGKPYNSKTDIWSLGCILYELCTLKHAFEAANMNALLMNIVRGRYTPIPAQYSQDLRSLVDKMLTKEPEKRPNINQILSLPFIKNRLSDFLNQTLLEYEMNHTVIHGRKAFQQATIVQPKKVEPPPQPQPAPAAEQKPPAKNTEQIKKENEIREKQKQMMLEAKRRQQEQEEQERKKRLAREEEERRKREREQQMIRDREEAARRAKQDEFDDRAKAVQAAKERAHGEFNFDYNDATYKNPLQLKREREKKEQEAAYNRQMAGRAAQPDYQHMPQQNYAYQNRNDQAQQQRQAERDRQAERERRKREDEEKMAEERQRIFMEQKKAREANKNRNRNELFGANECFQYNDPDPEPPRRKVDDRAARQKREEEERRRIWEEQRAEANKNRNRARNDMRGDNMRDALFQGDDEPQPRRGRDARKAVDDEAERRRIWEEQRAEANKNRNRARNDMRGDNMKDALFQGYDDDDKYERNNNDNRRGKELDDAARRKAYEEQRRAAKENKEKMKRLEMGGGAAAEAMNDPYIHDYDSPKEDRIAKHEIDEAARRKAYEEQRRAARENKEKMKRLEMGGGAAADALYDPSADEYQAHDERIAKHEIDDAARRKAYDEQRRAARENKERMKRLEMGGGAAADALYDPSADEEKAHDERIAKHEIGEDERRKAWEEQRRAARANRDKMRQLELGGGGAADALADGSEDDYQHHDERIAKHEIGEDERRKAWEEQRRAAKANREKMRQLELGGGAAADALGDDNDDDDYKAHDERIAKHEIGEDERRKAWEEQRRAAKANREKMRQLELGGGDAANALGDGSEDDYKAHDERIAKHEIGEDERRKAWEEQRRAAKANREKMRQLELGGGDAANALGDDNDDDVKEKAPDRIAKHEIDDADRRKAWEEQRRAAKANREKMRKLELGGGDAADALGTEDNEDSHAKSPDRIAKHEIDDAERRRIYEEQRRETKANREKMRNVELGNGPAPEAQEQQEEQASSRKQEKHQPTADELAELARQQRREARANRERLKAQAAGVNMDRLVQEALGPDGFGPSHGGAKIPRDSPVEQQKPVEQPHDDIQDDEPVPKKQEKHQPTAEELAELARQQRREARANRERLKAQAAGVDMDKLVQEALGPNGFGPSHGGAKIPRDSPVEQQKVEEVKDEEPLPKKQEKHQPTADELAELARQQRREARANRERLKAQAAGVDMDKLVQEALGPEGLGPARGKVKRDEPAPKKEEAAPQPEAANDDNEPVPQKEKQHEITPEERRAAYNEQRAIRKKAEAAAKEGLDELAALEAELNSKPKKVRPPPKFLARLQKKPAADASDDSSSARSSARSIDSDAETPRRKPHNVKVQAAKPVEMPKIEEEPKGMNANFGQALSSKSAKEFLKSRTLVIEQLNQADKAAEENADLPVDPSIEAGNEPTPEEQQSVIEDKAKFIEEALCIDGKEANNDEDFDGHENDENKDSSSFHLAGMSVDLPVAHDSDSCAYRAEALRAFLEKQIGFDRVIELKEMMNNADSDVDMNKYLNDIQPGLVLLVQHLLILDDDASSLRI